MTLEKLKEKYGEVIYIHTPTRTDWNNVIKKLFEIGLTWRSGDDSELYSDWWETYRNNTYIIINYSGDKKIGFGAVTGKVDGISAKGFLSNFKKEKIIINKKKRYRVGDFELKMSSNNLVSNCSMLKIFKGTRLVLVTYIGKKDLSISEVNKILEVLNINAEIVEPVKTIKLKSENGQEIEVDTEKAKELGIVV